MLHALEDDGVYCVDNFPAGMLTDLVGHLEASDNPHTVAVCIDIRNRMQDLSILPKAINELKAKGIKTRLVYLDAQGAVLVKRFSDTRRRHPLDQSGMDLKQAIRAESKVLEKIAEIADLIVDTTTFTSHDLVVLTSDRLLKQTTTSISLLFQSFGYKNGVPVDADMVFDARCLPNPHWIPELRHLSGLDLEVKDYLDNEPLVERYFSMIRSFIEEWLSVFESQHRVYMTIAVGCTGGQHRSVYLVDRLGNTFSRKYPSLLQRHRELSE